jgi:hypothetical protein
MREFGDIRTGPNSAEDTRFRFLVAWHAPCSPSTRRDRASLRANQPEKNGFDDDV